MNPANGLSVDLTDRIGGISIEAKFSVAAGEILAVRGPSGSGKTTLLRGIAGLRTSLSGVVTCAGERWLDSDSSLCVPVEARRVGFVFQDYALFPQMTATANVRFGLSGIPRAERDSESIRLLDAVGLKNLADRRPADLSGGERQRLALARAVAVKPRVLLLDEPLASLDAGTATEALELIKRTVAELGVACLLVTHDERLARDHRTLSLDPGLNARIL